jgi:peptidoglycan L-alanyl-D-glutamate endopeptidase CwlK
LVRLVLAVGAVRDVAVVQGARSLEAEKQAIASGHSSLTNPMDSKHVVDPATRPLALAVDLAPFPVKWSDIPGFQSLAVLVKETAVKLGIGLHWGGDWVHFKDWDHFELVSTC